MKSTVKAEMPMNPIARKIDAIQRKGAMLAVDIANILDARPETVSRWNQGKAFPQPEKEKRLLDLEYVIDQLAELYEPTDARLWLFGRQKLLDGKTPAALIQEGQTEEVLRVIGQLRDGIFV